MSTQWMEAETGNVVGVMSSRGSANGGGTRWTWVVEKSDRPAGRTMVLSETGDRQPLAWVVGTASEVRTDVWESMSAEEYIAKRFDPRDQDTLNEWSGIVDAMFENVVGGPWGK